MGSRERCSTPSTIAGKLEVGEVQRREIAAVWPAKVEATWHATDLRAFPSAHGQG